MSKTATYAVGAIATGLGVWLGYNLYHRSELTKRLHRSGLYDKETAKEQAKEAIPFFSVKSWKVAAEEELGIDPEDIPLPDDEGPNWVPPEDRNLLQSVWSNMPDLTPGFDSSDYLPTFVTGRKA